MVRKRRILLGSLVARAHLRTQQVEHFQHHQRAVEGQRAAHTVADIGVWGAVRCENRVGGLGRLRLLGGSSSSRLGLPSVRPGATGSGGRGANLSQVADELGGGSDGGQTATGGGGAS